MMFRKKSDDLFPVCKFMSCRFSCSARDLVYHQYGICRMYSEENPQDFRLPVPCLYSGERVMLLLSAEASFKPGGPFFGEFTSEHLRWHYWHIWNRQPRILPSHS